MALSDGLICVLMTAFESKLRTISWKSFLFNLDFENKRVRKIFGSGTMYENVPQHAQRPPNFPHSQRQSRGVSCEEGGEVAGGDNASGFMTSEHQQPALAAGHKI